MTEIKELSNTFECVKVAMTQDKNGHILRLSIHPHDTPEDIMRDPVGQRYKAVLVRVGDDEQPVPSPMMEEGQRAVMIAGTLGANPEFQSYLVLTGDIEEASEDFAAAFIRSFCGVASRADLKFNKEARQKLEELKNDFMAHLRNDALYRRS